MRVLFLFNVADAQSISLEIGLRIRRDHRRLHLVAYRDSDAFPAFAEDQVSKLSAKSPLSPRALLALFRLIARERPDVVHVHNGVSVLAGALFGKMFGARVVKTEHNDHRFQRRVERIVNALSFPLVDLIACNSRSTMLSFSAIEARLGGRRACVVYNGVDLERLDRAVEGSDGRARLGLPATAPLIGAACRFVPQKNLDRLVEAFALLGDTLPDARLVLVGTGPLRPRLDALARERGVGERVIFTGALPREDVYRFMRAVDAFVVPSLWEGYCNAAVEAMAAGAPVVAADIVTLREVLRDHADYVDPASPGSIAEAIRTVLGQDPGMRRARTQAARAFVEATYSLDRTATLYRHYYEALVSGERGRDLATRSRDRGGEPVAVLD